MNTPEGFVRGYGRTWRTGVLSEHEAAFTAAGGTIRPAASGSGLAWAVLPDGSAHPVVCPDLVPVPTEDGMIVGRCGADAVRDGACEGHAAETEAWLAATEDERVAWERDHDAAGV